ncbi:hypothetical protein HAX54_046096 [Datura stramonium]|uniref:Uncharacterized protein n=1 Tax=Datura stramonium TaxID=4076 RepID=A0ABS8SQY1_DATST|nr:hypothetical protein [Datura stramonium]
MLKQFYEVYQNGVELMTIKSKSDSEPSTPCAHLLLHVAWLTFILFLKHICVCVEFQLRGLDVVSPPPFYIDPPLVAGFSTLFPLKIILVARAWCSPVAYHQKEILQLKDSCSSSLM